MEIVHLRFDVEVIAPVAYGVDGRHGAGGTEHLAPSVVAVFGYAVAAGIHDPDDVTLEVLAVEVLRLRVSGDVGEADDCTFGVMVEVQGVIVHDLRNQCAAPVDIAVNIAANSL